METKRKEIASAQFSVCLGGPTHMVGVGQVSVAYQTAADPHLSDDSMGIESDVVTRKDGRP